MPIMVAVINAKSKTLPCVPGLSLNRRTVGQASCLSCGAGFQPALTRRVRVLRHRQESPPEQRPASPSPGGEGRGECEGLLKLDSGGERLGASQQLPFWEGLATG